MDRRIWTEEYGPKLPKNMEEQLRLGHKMFLTIDCPYRKTLWILLRYKVEKPENASAQVGLGLKKKH